VISCFSYNICVRPEAGYCCIQYSLCTDANSFTIDSASTVLLESDTATACTNDYIEIDGSGASQCQSRQGIVASNTRYCGRIFSFVNTDISNQIICGTYHFKSFTFL
jgi:hypothetical protein